MWRVIIEHVETVLVLLVAGAVYAFALIMFSFIILLGLDMWDPALHGTCVAIAAGVMIERSDITQPDMTTYVWLAGGTVCAWWMYDVLCSIPATLCTDAHELSSFGAYAFALCGLIALILKSRSMG